MTWLDLGLRLLVALGAGLALGLERELRGHPAGLRTHVLVSVGAALFTLAGAYGFSDVAHGPNVDPARIAAQVASGIGFIGAGAILRNGQSITGLTTAATLWLAASVGVTAAAGDIGLVVIGTGIVLVTLVGLPYVRPSRWTAKETVTISLGCEPGGGALTAVLSAMRSSSYRIGDIDVDDDDDRRVRHVTLRAMVPRNLKREILIQRLSNIPSVRTVSVRTDEDAG